MVRVGPVISVDESEAGVVTIKVAALDWLEAEYGAVDGRLELLDIDAEKGPTVLDVAFPGALEL